MPTDHDYGRHATDEERALLEARLEAIFRPVRKAIGDTAEMFIVRHLCPKCWARTVVTEAALFLAFIASPAIQGDEDIEHIAEIVITALRLHAPRIKALRAKAEAMSAADGEALLQSFIKH